MERTNDDRAEDAFKAIHKSSYNKVRENDSMEGAIGDLMSDLLHLAEQYGIDITELLERAERNYIDER